MGGNYCVTATVNSGGKRYAAPLESNVSLERARFVQAEAPPGSVLYIGGRQAVVEATRVGRCGMQSFRGLGDAASEALAATVKQTALTYVEYEADWAEVAKRSAVGTLSGAAVGGIIGVAAGGRGNRRRMAFRSAPVGALALGGLSVANQAMSRRKTVEMLAAGNPTGDPSAILDDPDVSGALNKALMREGLVSGAIALGLFGVTALLKVWK